MENSSSSKKDKGKQKEEIIEEEYIEEILKILYIEDKKINIENGISIQDFFLLITNKFFQKYPNFKLPNFVLFWEKNIGEIESIINYPKIIQENKDVSSQICDFCDAKSNENNSSLSAWCHIKDIDKLSKELNISSHLFRNNNLWMCSNCYQQGIIINNQGEELWSFFKFRINYLNSIKFTIEQITRFQTRFNNNIATIITKIRDNNESYYLVFLGLIDNKQIYFFPTNPFYKWWGKGEYSRKEHSNFINALEEAKWLEKQLKEHSNPILFIHPLCDVDTYFHDLIKEPYVKIEVLSDDKNISISDDELNIVSNKLQIGDIVAFRYKSTKIGIHITNFYHFEIYIGNGETIGMSGARNGVRSSSIEENIRDKDFTGKIVKFHPIIPFRNIKGIIKHAWTNQYRLWEDEYSLENRNCQHFANSVVFGINYSEEMELREIEMEMSKVYGYTYGSAVGIGIPLTICGYIGYALALGTILTIPPATPLLLSIGGIGGISTIWGLSRLADPDYLNNELINNRSKIDKIIEKQKSFGSRWDCKKIKLIDEIKETNSLLEVSFIHDKDKEKIEEINKQYIQQLEKHYSIDECKLM